MLKRIFRRIFAEKMRPGTKKNAPPAQGRPSSPRPQGILPGPLRNGLL